MRVLSVMAEKGGVGKTNTCVNIGYILADMGYRTLLIDLDYQAGTTSWCGIEPNEVEGRSAAEVFYGEKQFKEIIKRLGPNLFIAPGHDRLKEVNYDFDLKDSDLTKTMKKIINTAKNLDFVIFDNSPADGFTQRNSYKAAKEIIIPVQMKKQSAKGLSRVIPMVESVSADNPGVHVLGIIANQYQKERVLDQIVYPGIEKTFGTLVFDTKIPESTKAGLAELRSEPIIKNYRWHPIGLAWKALTKEVLARGEEKGSRYAEWKKKRTKTG